MGKLWAKKQLNFQPMLCPGCGFVYTPKYGDPESNIPSYTNFADIEDWRCPICDGSKDAFIPYIPTMEITAKDDMTEKTEEQHAPLAQ